MAIETQDSKVLYQGDGAAVVFPVPYPVHRAEHLRLYLATALDREIAMEESEYTVDGAGTGAVSVTLSAPLPSGKSLAIVRLVPLLQQMDLENGGSFDAETIERQMDILEMQIQQLQEKVDRTIVIPVTSGRDPDDFWRDLLEAYRATLETYRAMLALFDAQTLDSYAVNARRSIVVTEAVPAGGILTLPAWYYPKRNILYLSVDGMVCTPRLPDNADQSERQYEEVGEDANELSNQVRVFFPVEAGMLVDAWVVSSNHTADMSQVEDLIAEAAASAAEAAQGAEDARGEAGRAAEGAAAAGEKALEAAASAAEAARAATEAGTGAGSIPTASPAERGLAPAGGTAGQVYRVNADGTAYGWEDAAEAEEIPLAAPGAPGLAPSGGTAGQVYQVSADGQSYGWKEPDVTQEELNAGLAGKLDTSRYDADAWKLNAAWAIIDGGTLIASKNIISVSRTSTGVYRIYSPAIKPNSIVCTQGWTGSFCPWANKAGAQFVTRTDSNDGQFVQIMTLLGATATGWQTATDGAFSIVILNNVG